MSSSRFAGLALIMAFFLVLPGSSQDSRPNEREVKTAPSKAGKSDVWTLDLRFKDPRILKAHIPGRGTRICWYLWYQVINRTEKAVRFQPIFELVTHDYPASYQDEILPTVEDAVRKLEDPNDYLKIKSTYAIGLNLIPVSKPPEEAFQRPATSRGTIFASFALSPAPSGTRRRWI